MLAEALRLRPPLVLRVQTAQLPLAVALSLEPESNGDWEAVRREAGQLEQQILAQLLVVGKEQRLPLWVNGTQNIWLRVTDVCLAAARCEHLVMTALGQHYSRKRACLDGVAQRRARAMCLEHVHLGCRSASVGERGPQQSLLCRTAGSRQARAPPILPYRAAVHAGNV